MLLSDRLPGLLKDAPGLELLFTLSDVQLTAAGLVCLEKGAFIPLAAQLLHSANRIALFGHGCELLLEIELLVADCLLMHTQFVLWNII